MHRTPLPGLAIGAMTRLVVASFEFEKQLNIGFYLSDFVLRGQLRGKHGLWQPPNHGIVAHTHAARDRDRKRELQ